MTDRTRQKLSENTALLCKDLGIPYDPNNYDTDPRVEVIYNALSWTAEDVENQMKDQS